MTYQQLLRRNINLMRVKIFFTSLLFFLPIWYAFEGLFAPAATLAVIYAVTHLISVFLELPTGALADLLGRKYIVFLGLLIGGGSYIFISQSQSVSWLWIGAVFAQIGSTFVSGADTALFYDTLKELKKESQFSLLANQNELVYRIGLTIAAFTGGYIFLYYYRLPYALVGIAMIMAGIVTLFMVEPHIDSEKFTITNYIQQTKLGFGELFKTPYIRDFSLYYISISGITWYYLYFLLNVFTTDVGFNAIERGWIAAVNSIIVAIVGIVIAKYKLFSRATAYLFFPICLLLGFLFAPILPKIATTISIFLIYIASIYRWTILDQYTNMEFESKYRATAISALGMATSLIYFLLTFSLNPILSIFGSGWVMFSLGVLTLLTTVPTTIVLLKKHR
ncbi:MAG: putative membrane protein [Microgenomates group bacterium GW2011_GWC1_39_12]|nr:MAG: putative membrane protein [Microgenomates group bacterium GW2011_GWC1_39_12]